MTITLLALTALARACQCSGGDVQRLMPEKGSVNLPINTHVFARESEMWVGYTQAEDLEWQIEPPVDGMAVEFRDYGDDGRRGVEVWGSEDFPPDAYVVLWDYASDSDVTTFTTGTDRDDEAPTWSPRRYSSDFSYTEYAGTGCESTAITFRIDGVADSGGFLPLFLLEPLDATGEIDFSAGEEGASTRVGASFTEACGGDANILKPSGRNYNLTILDIAGNTIDGGVLRGSCACSTASGLPSGSTATVVGLGLMVGLRRRFRLRRG